MLIKSSYIKRSRTVEEANDTAKKCCQPYHILFNRMTQNKIKACIEFDHTNSCVLDSCEFDIFMLFKSSYVRGLSNWQRFYWREWPTNWRHLRCNRCSTHSMLYSTRSLCSFPISVCSTNLYQQNKFARMKFYSGVFFWHNSQSQKVIWNVPSRKKSNVNGLKARIIISRRTSYSRLTQLKQQESDITVFQIWLLSGLLVNLNRSTSPH